jgi:hypothetical protein
MTIPSIRPVALPSIKPSTQTVAALREVRLQRAYTLIADSMAKPLLGGFFGGLGFWSALKVLKGVLLAPPV